jgi:NADH dehydrogenase (ubiquinone) 1 beta subcomplex subunit 10
MEARIVRENLQKCYRVEGVNSIEKCKELAERYTQMLKENRVSETLL